MRNPTGFLVRMSRTYGDVARFRIGRHHAFLINHPDLIHFVLVERPDAFTKTSLRAATYRLVGDSLFSSQGDDHDRKRAVMQPQFRHERLKGIADVAVALANETADRWGEAATVDAWKEMARLSVWVAGASVLSLRKEEEVARFSTALEGAIKTFERTVNPAGGVLDRLPLSSTRRIEASSVELETIVDAVIAARRKSPQAADDLLGMLIDLRFDADGKEAMTDLELRHEVIDLAIGSHPVLALALTWSLYELSRNAEAQAAVAGQARDLLGDRPAQFEDAPRLTLARAAFNEALRLHPPAWVFLRKAKAEIRVGGYRVPKGGLILLSPYVTHHDPRFYPEPLAFELGRWDGPARASRPKFAYFPFGGGPRGCIGEPLATAEGTLILATLLRRFKIEPAGTAPTKEWALGLQKPGVVPVQVRSRASKS